MSDAHLSPEQPPAWQGPEIGATPTTPPPAPVPPPVGPEPKPGSLVPRTPLRFTRTLDLSWEIVRKHWRSLFWAAVLPVMLAVVVAIPLLTNLYSRYPQLLDPNFINSNAQISLDMASAVLSALAVVALTAVVGQAWMNVRVGAIAMAEVRGVERTRIQPRALWRYIAVQLQVTAIFFVMLLPGLIATAVYGQAGAAFSVGLLLGALGWVVWLALGLLPLTGVVLVENISGRAALRRSLQLSRRRRWAGFAPVLVVSIAANIAGQAIANFLTLLKSDQPLVTAVVDAVTTGLVTLISGPFIVVATLLVYISRRLESEPPAADVFDQE